MLTPRAVADGLAEVDRTVVITALTRPESSRAYRRALIDFLEERAPHPGRWRYHPQPSSGARTLIAHVAELIASAAPFPLQDLARAHVERQGSLLDVIGDDAGFSAWSRRHYTLPVAADVTEAYTLLCEPAPTAEPTYPAHDLFEGLRSALDGYRLTQWRVVLDPGMTARASVSRARRLVRVREGERFSQKEIRRLVVHEVGCHVLRGHNAQGQREPLAVTGFGNAIATEEGLAVWLEVATGVQTPQVRRTYAARLVAVHWAQELGLTDLAIRLADLVGPVQAAELALRVKRGLRDPEGPGGWTKDHCYWSGSSAVSTLLTRRDRTATLLSLFAVKWPIEMLGVIDDLLNTGVLDPPQLLPRELHLERNR